MNDVLREHLYKGVLVYLDDILFYSKTRDEHITLLRNVLNLLRNNDLKAKLSKCSFLQDEVEFCGYTVSKDGIQCQESKLESIRNWPLPTGIKELRSFLGLSNFYHRFIRNYAEVAQPLHSMLRKNSKWDWTPDRKEAFEK